MKVYKTLWLTLKAEDKLVAGFIRSLEACVCVPAVQVCYWGSMNVVNH